MTATTAFVPFALLPPSFEEREKIATEWLDDSLCEFFDLDGTPNAIALDQLFRHFCEWRQVRAERAVWALCEFFRDDPQGRLLAHVFIDDRSLSKET